MRYPRFLQENGTIAFVAPSFGCASEPYKAGFFVRRRSGDRKGMGLSWGPTAMWSREWASVTSPDCAVRN